MKIPKSDAVNFAEQVRLNQQKLASGLKSHYDFIVCGSGTSGSVVAARLAADLNTQVLLLEAGGTNQTDLVTNPNRWPMTLGSELDWGFVTEPNPHLNGRAIRYSMGRSWEAVPASMSRHGLVDTEPIGTSTHPNRTIHLGVTQPFWICTAAVLRPGWKPRSGLPRDARNGARAAGGRSSPILHGLTRRR